MSAITAIYEGGVFRPTTPVALPERCEVDLEFHVRQPESTPVNGAESAAPSIEDKLAALAAQVPEDEWDLLPADLSDQLDHHVYGMPPQ